MYESPVKRRMRAAVDDAVSDADFAERLIHAIDTDEGVRSAVIRLLRRHIAATKPAPQTSRGRGR